MDGARHPAPPAEESGSASLFRTLKAGGVELIFCNPGTTEMHLVAGIDAVPGVRAVLCLHEGVAAGAADGYFRLARKPAAVLLHLGPGLANAGAQLHNAHRARSPVLALVGDLASWHARDAPLRTDIAAIAASLTSGWVRTCADGARLASDAVDALEAMAGVGRGARESRVASLVVSHDASWARVPRSLADASSAAAAAMRSAHGAAEAAPNSAALVASGGSGGSGSGGHAASLGTAFSFFTFFNDAAAALRRHGPASAILLGGSALVGASLAIAAAISAQTGCALLCENNFARLDRGAGVAAVQRVPYFPRDAEAFLRPFKALVLIEAPLPVAMFGYDGSAATRGDVCFLSDDDIWDADTSDGPGCLAALAAALQLLPSPHQVAAPAAPPNYHGDALLRRTVSAASMQGRGAALTPALLCSVVASLQPANAIIVDESLTSGGTYWDQSAGAPPFTHLALTGGAIGSGLPLALGAAVAAPSRRVILIQADGSGLYSPQALWTLAREALDVVVIVCANQRYGILKLEASLQRCGPPGAAGRSLTDLSNPPVDWCALARGFGVRAHAVSTAGALADELERGLARLGPTLIEAFLP